MNGIEPPKLYKQYFIDKNDERLELFRILKSRFNVKNGIYPGSFVHITPSIFIPEMVYVDNDKRIDKFYSDKHIKKYIESIKEYDEEVKITGFQLDYNKELPVKENYYEIMFSFYSGFILQSCKKYLKKDGILVCNNSHGDSSVAILDNDYKFIGVVERDGNNFNISDKDLDLYFAKKDGSIIDREKVLENMKGEKFTKECYAYIFIKN